MAIEVFNRYEKKYLVPKVLFPQIEERLLPYMEPDAYNQNNRPYTISNIYLDTADNHMIRTSLSKPRYKEKLRIRAYQTPGPDDMIYLEVKKKVSGLVNKRRTSLKLKEAYAFIETGEMPSYQPYMNCQVLHELAYALRIYKPKPKLCLFYDRLAYFEKNASDLRITLDTKITARRDGLRLEEGPGGERLLDDGFYLMEIKSRYSFPLWLTRMLSEYKIYATSFSKYGAEYHQMLVQSIVAKGGAVLCPSKNSLQQGRLTPLYL